MPGAIVASAGWAALGQPAAALGLGVALGCAAVAVVWAGLFVPSRGAAGVLATRRARAAHRHRHGREHCASAQHSDRLWRLAKFAGRHRCVFCGSRADLQVDHYFPWSWGGLTALFNLMVLCGRCNRIKSNYWPGHHYRPMPGADNVALAAQIFAAEWRARRSPVYWVLNILAAL